MCFGFVVEAHKRTGGHISTRYFHSSRSKANCQRDAWWRRLWLVFSMRRSYLWVTNKTEVWLVFSMRRSYYCDKQDGRRYDLFSVSDGLICDKQDGRRCDLFSVWDGLICDKQDGRWCLFFFVKLVLRLVFSMRRSYRVRVRVWVRVNPTQQHVN